MQHTGLETMEDTGGYSFHLYFQEVTAVQREAPRVVNVSDRARKPALHAQQAMVQRHRTPRYSERIEEYDEDLAFNIQDLSSRTLHTEQNARFSCVLEDINCICGELGIPWQLEKDTP